MAIGVIRNRNTAIVEEDDIYVNRVECDTAFDFDRVEQILISEPVPCPVKEGYSYVGRAAVDSRIGSCDSVLQEHSAHSPLLLQRRVHAKGSQFVRLAVHQQQVEVDAVECESV